MSSDGGVTNSGSGTGALNAAGDQINTTNPMLGPLAYYGGPTATHILLSGSPAIDKGKNFSGATTDQRGTGFARTVGSAAVTGGDGTDVGAFERQASDIDPTLIVTKTADTNDGVCDADCSLREALAAAADGNAIYFSVTGTITLTSGHLLVGKSVTISGPGADVLAVNGNANGRVFYIGSGKTVSISGLTITNGAVGDEGGGIYNDHAELTMTGCTIRGNSCTGGSSAGGGGIFNFEATLTLSNCTISGNLTFGDVNAGNVSRGGGIYNFGGTFALNSCTISGNAAGQGDADGLGGGIFNSGSLTIVNSTFSGNSVTSGQVGGSIYNTLTVVTADTIFNAGDFGGNFFNSGTITSHGYNLSSDAAGGDTGTGPGGVLNGTSDIRNTDPKLGPLANNGGPTFTHALLPTSPAIDKGKNSTSATTDQRGPGFVRTFDNLSIANAMGGDGTDIGAYEVQDTPPTITGATILRQQGSPASNSPIATVSDAETPAGQLTVTVVPPLPTGITVTNIVNTNGTVTADVAAGCDAAVGSNTVTLQVSDGQLTATGNLTVNVTANTAPVITLKPSPVLNTPNHKYHTFMVPDLVASATDNSGNLLSSVVITSASSDEPEDAKGNGDGATLNDIVILSCTSLKVRAERADSGSGRIYHVNLSVTDNCGATTTATATVLVPNNGSTIDDCPSGVGCAYSVTQPGTRP